MAAGGDRLYPPTIGGSIPAFYEENGTAIIAVPFSMNRAVSSSDFGGFRIKIKTVQSNTLIKTLDNYEKTNSLTNRIVKFTWDNLANDTDFKKIRLGQYLKIQMAYISNSGTIGYFSTVGVIKFTSKPNVYIKIPENSEYQTQIYKQNYIGIFETGEDKSERPYSYCFFLYDSIKGLVETSGWKLHNTSINNIASESLSLDQSIDTFTFQSLLESNKIYYIQYAVKTINNLEVYSQMYACTDPQTPESSLKVLLAANNVFEEGYIDLALQLRTGYTINTDEELLAMYASKGAVAVVTDEEVNLENNTSIVYKKFAIDQQQQTLLTDENGEVISLIYVNLNKPVSIEVCRASKLDNYSSWQVLKKAYFNTYQKALSWTYKDFTVEQGITYKYCFRQYNEAGVQSNRMESAPIVADFEDMFLWDGIKQLKIRFNPKVSSFKTTRFEQKIDTIGSKYPFIFRNGVVSYKEFPIAGLISYRADNNEWFAKASELDLISNEVAERIGSPVDQNENDCIEGKSWEKSVTLDSTAYNIRAERLFKLKLLDWLGDGKIKMFKSPQEGNYFVRLVNISLTPEDKLGRMLHSFSCTAYEVEELSYNNLIDMGFLNINDETETTIQTNTIYFREKISQITNVRYSVKINDNDVVDYFKIEPTGVGFFVRLGADQAANRVFIQPEGLTFDTRSNARIKLPDIYFNLEDNAEFLENFNYIDLNRLKAEGISLVGDAQLKYTYIETDSLVGDFEGIKSVYIENKIHSYNGPQRLSFNFKDNVLPVAGANKTEQVLKFFVLNLKRKVIKDVLQKSNSLYYDIDTDNEISHFDDFSLYCIYNENNIMTSFNYSVNGNLTLIADTSNSGELYVNSSIQDENDLYAYGTTFYDANGNIVYLYDTQKVYRIYSQVNNRLLDIALASDPNTLISLIDTSVSVKNYNEATLYEFKNIPALNLNDAYYERINLGSGVILDCAYQSKITEYYI